MEVHELEASEQEVLSKSELKLSVKKKAPVQGTRYQAYYPRNLAQTSPARSEGVDFEGGGCRLQGP